MKIFQASAVLLAGALAVQAQSGYGVVRGTVHDQTRSSIPAARITLTNVSTNVIQSAVSSDTGGFYFGTVPNGAYRLLVEAGGFRKWSGALDLQVGQTALIDPKLEVGSVETVVEVSGAAPLISTGSTDIADVKDRNAIITLPLNGRRIEKLYELTPGVEGGGSPRVNGLKVGSLEVMLDGVAQNDQFLGGSGTHFGPEHGSQAVAGLDSIAEFRIETAGSDARTQTPATVTLVTRSGTNLFHGSLFATHRNDSAGLRTRRRQDETVASKLIRNEFGFSAGGPVRLGKLYDGLNRTFWYANYEGARLVTTSEFGQGSVPTASLWSGDFSNIVDNSGFRTNIYDPLTTDARGVRQPLAGNVVPQGRINPLYRKISEIVHSPTNQTNPFQGPNIGVSYPVRSPSHVYSIKGDHTFSTRDSLSGRFSAAKWSTAREGGLSDAFPREGLANSYGSVTSHVQRHTASITHTHLFSPSLFSEMLLATSVTRSHDGGLGDRVKFAEQLGLPNPFDLPDWPTILADSMRLVAAYGSEDRNAAAHSVEDNLTWVRGKHSFRFGAKIRYEYNNSVRASDNAGAHTFGSAWTGLYDPIGDQGVPRTGAGLASMALGLPARLSQWSRREKIYLEEQEAGLYVQDNWRLTRRLTLNAGLRWDFFSAYEEKYNRLPLLDIDNVETKFQVVTPKSSRVEDLPNINPAVLGSWRARGLTWTNARQGGYPDNLYAGDNNNFGPRLGLAFEITRGTVIRAGYGEYYWRTPLRQLFSGDVNATPPQVVSFPNLAATGEVNGVNRANRSVPQADFYIGRAQIPVGVTALSANAQNLLGIDNRHWKDNRARSLNFTIEREMRGIAVRTSYIGNAGRNLEQRFALNSQESLFNHQARTGIAYPSNLRADLRRINPDVAANVVNKTGYSNTHSLQAEVERKFSRGLGFQWSYTFTRSLTTTDAGSGNSSPGVDINGSGGSAIVPENIQVWGNPNMTYDQRLRLGYSNSGAVPAHRLRWNGIYDLPFGRGRQFAKNLSGALNHLAGGWQIATINDWRSGNWLNVGTGAYLFGDPTLSAGQRLLFNYNGRSQRLWWRGDFDPLRAVGVSQEALQSLVPADRAKRTYRPLGAGFDNRVPQTLADGSVRLTSVTDMVSWSARRFLQGPGAWNSDVSLFKHIPITERVKARFTADFFNFFNHPNDANPNGSTGLQDLSVQTNEPRIIQFSLRLDW